MRAKKLVLIDDTMREVSKEEKEPTTLWGKPWTHGADVMATFKRFGFKPPTEYRNDFRFRVNREGGQFDD